MRALLAAALLASAAAHGQTTGSMLGDGPIDAPEGRTVGDKARAIGDVFATCVVRRHYVQVKKALAAPADMAADNRSLPAFLDSECLSGTDTGTMRHVGGADVELQTNPVSFRGSLYKALVRKDFARSALTVAATAPALGGYNGTALAFADCVVRHDTASSLQLLQAPAGFASEAAAVTALRPAFAQCITPGAQFRFSRGSLVGFIAEAYYREATTASGRSGA